MEKPQQQPASRSPLAQIGPHGYPMRFGVRLAGLKGMKVYGEDPDQPIRFIEVHTRRQILHASAHKKEKSPALVSIQANWPVWSLTPLDDTATFTVTVHQNPEEGNEGPVTTFPMDHTRCRPVTFRFELPSHLLPGSTIATTTSTATPTATPTAPSTGVETFEWRRAPTCTETRGIRKKTLPVLETGDERPHECNTIFALPGAILVRTTPTTSTSATTSTTDCSSTRCPPGPDRPLGYTRQGEEIVASWSEARDLRPRFYFQFWGAGAKGVLGEVFSHVAVLTGTAVYLDEKAEQSRRKDFISDETLLHGQSSALLAADLAREGDLVWRRHRR